MTVKMIQKSVLFLLVLSPFSQAAEAPMEWEVLKMNGYEHVEVSVGRPAEPKYGKGYFFHMRRKWLIEGKMSEQGELSALYESFFHMCGSRALTPVTSRSWDMSGKDLGTKVGPNEPIDIDKDPDWKRAARYVCGDKTAKMRPYAGPPKANPINDKVLACGFPGSKDELTFVLNEPAGTVDGSPALFRTRNVKFVMPGDGTSSRGFHIEIDRFTGKVNLKSYDQMKSIDGNCEARASGKF